MHLENWMRRKALSDPWLPSILGLGPIQKGVPTGMRLAVRQCFFNGFVSAVIEKRPALKSRAGLMAQAHVFPLPWWKDRDFFAFFEYKKFNKCEASPELSF
jgi:hypothetical protein